MTIFAVSAYAQNFYKPSDKWPYIFEEFSDGSVFQTDGTEFQGKINICIDNGSVHYIDDEGVILEAIMKDIVRAEVGGKKFINANNKMMEILAEDENGYVVKERFVKQGGQGVDIGFGITSETVAAQGIDLTTTTAFGGTFIHSQINDVIRDREFGASLNIGEQLFIRTVNGIYLPATKQDLQDLIGKDKANKFLKEHKIKWTDYTSLLQIVDFVKSEI